MKLTNNQWIIVGVVALIVIWYFFIRKKPTTESESGYMTEPASPLLFLGLYAIALPIIAIVAYMILYPETPNKYPRSKK